MNLEDGISDIKLKEELSHFIESWMIPEESILPVDMLSQSLSDKTEDCGKNWTASRDCLVQFREAVQFYIKSSLIYLCWELYFYSRE